MVVQVRVSVILDAIPLSIQSIDEDPITFHDEINAKSRKLQKVHILALATVYAHKALIKHWKTTRNLATLRLSMPRMCYFRFCLFVLRFQKNEWPSFTKMNSKQAIKI